MSNPFEQAGRLTKAFAIAQALFRSGITAEQAVLQTADEWATTAMCAGYAKPPSDETRRICIEKLAGFRSDEPPADWEPDLNAETGRERQLAEYKEKYR